MIGELSFVSPRLCGNGRGFIFAVAAPLGSVIALRDGFDADDPRVGPSAPLEWLPDIHRWQVQRLAR